MTIHTTLIRWAAVAGLAFSIPAGFGADHSLEPEGGERVAYGLHE